MELHYTTTVASIVKENNELNRFIDSNEIKKYYGDLNWGVVVINNDLKCTYSDNTLVLKKSKYIKIRREGKRYFSKKLYVHYLKIDFTSGNFLTLYRCGGMKRKRSLIFRTNSFDKLSEYLDFNSNYFWDDVDTEKETKVKNGIIHVLKDQLKFGNSYLYTDNPLDLMTAIFISKKGIKIPNKNAGLLLRYFYPTQKFLKKNNNKLVQSVLDLLGMRDSFTIKIVHKYPRVDLRTVKTLHHLLGSKYMSNLDEDIFSTNTSTWNDPNINKFTFLSLNERLKRLPDLTNKEKSNMVKVINDNVKQHIKSEDFYDPNQPMVFSDESRINFEGLCVMLIDHVEMIKQIMEYDPQIAISSTTARTFNFEHTRLSQLVSNIKRGVVVSYKFDSDMVKDIETPLGGFIPYILKDENEYREEGKFMKHCVGIYYKKEDSIIVSLRKDNKRWTCEYDVHTGKLLQSMGKMNTPPDDYVIPYIDLITNKAIAWSNKKKLKCLEKLTTPVKINGVEVSKGEYIDDLPF